MSLIDPIFFVFVA